MVDGATLAYQVTGLPEGASFDTQPQALNAPELLFVVFLFSMIVNG